MKATCIIVCSKLETRNPARFAVFCFDDDYAIDTCKQKRLERIFANVKNAECYSMEWYSKQDAMQKFAQMGVPCERIVDMGILSRWNDLHDCFNVANKCFNPKTRTFYTISGYDSNNADYFNLGNETVVSKPLVEIPF